LLTRMLLAKHLKAGMLQYRTRENAVRHTTPPPQMHCLYICTRAAIMLGLQVGCRPNSIQWISLQQGTILQSTSRIITGQERPLWKHLRHSMQSS
jgi:hypothetical protein